MPILGIFKKRKRKMAYDENTYKDDNAELRAKKEFTCGQDCSGCEIEKMVNSPPHYTQGKIETLVFILDQGFCYLIGNVIKYLCRYRFKGNPIQDLKKAQFYLDRKIYELEKEKGGTHED